MPRMSGDGCRAAHRCRVPASPIPPSRWRWKQWCRWRARWVRPARASSPPIIAARPGGMSSGWRMLVWLALPIANTPSAMAFHGGARARAGHQSAGLRRAHRGPRASGDRHGAVGGGARQDRLRQGRRERPSRMFGRWTTTGNPPRIRSRRWPGRCCQSAAPRVRRWHLIVEILCGALAGSNFGWEASAFMDAKGSPPELGQFLIAFDPAHFVGDSFAPRMAALVASMAADGARLPGDRRLALRATAARDGLAIADDLHAQIKALAGEVTRRLARSPIASDSPATGRPHSHSDLVVPIKVPRKRIAGHGRSLVDRPRVVEQMADRTISNPSRGWRAR